MKRIILAIAFVFVAFTSFSQTWVSDPAHSRLGFSISHLTISNITGNFKQFEVTVVSSKADHSDATVEVTAQVASINTDVEARDNHLKSVDFFDVQQFPTLKFKSTSLTKIKGNSYKLTGNLTLHGITRPVNLDVVLNGTVTNPMNKKETTGFSIKGILKRSEFNIGGKFPEAMVGDEVTLIASAELSPATK